MLNADRMVIGVCTEDTAKRAALLFDEVSIAVEWSRGLQLEQELDVLKPERVTILALEYEPFHPKVITGQTLWALAAAVSGGKLQGVPVYPSKTSFDTEFGAKEIEIFRILLENIPVVDESRLTWKQLSEVRKDPELIRGFRGLRIWMNSIDKDMSPQAFQDLLGQKLDDYRYGLKKHSIASLNGALSMFVDPAKLATLSGLVLGATLVGGELLAALSGGLLIAAESIIKVNEYLVGREQIRHDNADVAVIHQIGESLERCK